jgi:hypothetical protein
MTSNGMHSVLTILAHRIPCHRCALAVSDRRGITEQDSCQEMKVMRTLIVTDLYINAGFQMALNTLRRVGIRPTWLVMAVHVWALYYFLTFAVMCAIGEDLFGLLLDWVACASVL